MTGFGVMQGLLVLLLGLDAARVPEPIVVVGMILDVALITAVVAAVWNGLMLIGRTVAESLEVQNTKYRLIVARGLTRHDFNQVRTSIRGWYVMVVSYGTEEYLRTMAGEADRTLGRPRHGTSGMKLSLSSTGEAILRWTVPVHRRLGTQYRCFIRTRTGSSGPEVLTGMLKHYDEIEALIPDTASPTRIYFLLTHLPIIESAEGNRNNYASPE